MNDAERDKDRSLNKDTPVVQSRQEHWLIRAMPHKWNFLFLLCVGIFGVMAGIIFDRFYPYLHFCFCQSSFLQSHIFILVVIMTAAGLLGGTVNHFLTKEEIESGNGTTRVAKSYLGRCLWIGLAASFIVPLFLETVSSSIIDSSIKDSKNYLIFAGFCLIAAISSKAFIQTLSEKVLREVKDAKSAAVQAVAEVKEAQVKIEESTDAILAGQTDEEGDDDDEPLDSNKIPEQQFASSNVPILTQEELKVLGALIPGRFTYRSVKGLSKQTHLSEQEVEAIMQKLMDVRYANVLERKVGVGKYWYVKKRGRQAYEQATAPIPNSKTNS